MILRYSTEEMTSLWSDEEKYKIWLEVETLALEAMAKEGTVPAEAVQALREKGAFSVDRIDELEREVKHDVIAFLTCVAEYVGPLSRYVHQGMTSSDLLDTTLAVQLTRAGSLLITELDEVLVAVKKRAEEHRRTICIGRSHGIHAEPTTFGLKLLGWFAELQRCRVRLVSAVNEVAVGKIAGAVGTYASVSPEVEDYVMKALGLRAETVPTQIVQRDRHAQFFNTLAQIGASIERFAVEVRHLQRTEVYEAQEAFSRGQKGSSAMPHKKNPILSENLTGLARLLRGYAVSAIENVALWHERDISHSSVERVIAPDATTVCHFMLRRFKQLVSGLVVYPDRMKKNLESTGGLVFSGILLLRLTEKGLSREDAYRLVQSHAMKAWETGDSLKERALNDPEVKKHLSRGEIEGVFDYERYTVHVDTIFSRTLQNMT